MSPIRHVPLLGPIELLGVLAEAVDPVSLLPLPQRLPVVWQPYDRRCGLGSIQSEMCIGTLSIESRITMNSV